jgi:hypothetical protein
MGKIKITMMKEKEEDNETDFLMIKGFVNSS